MVTIKDIAREVGVSTSLVSFVMSNQQKGTKVYRVSDETEKRVLDAARRLNYQPNSNARALRSGRSRVIGVLISDIANIFYSEIARDISEWASQNDYVVLFGNTDESATKLSENIDLFEAKGVDGFIIVPCEGSFEAISELQKRGVPFVLVDREMPGLRSSVVTLDNFEASRLLVERLASKGCRKIEMVSYKTTLSNIKDRESGYSSAVADLGLEYSRIHTPHYSDYHEVEQVIKGAVQRGVDGLLFTTYKMAILGRRAMIELGYRVPEQCRVACFNNSEEFDIYERSLTYARQPIGQFASESLSILIDQIEGRSSGRKKIILDPEIVEIER